ncbi:MAG: hypothetical protein AB4060_22490 [Crocosphaera sp.]
MNTKLVDSLFEIIRSLEPTEFTLLNEKIQNLNNYNSSQKSPEILTSEERFKAIKEWAESHDYDTPLLSDYAVSRAGIYEED